MNKNECVWNQFNNFRQFARPLIFIGTCIQADGRDGPACSALVAGYQTQTTDSRWNHPGLQKSGQAKSTQLNSVIPTWKGAGRSRQRQRGIFGNRQGCQEGRQSDHNRQESQRAELEQPGDEAQ